MNDSLLRTQIRAVHREIHKLRQRPSHPDHADHADLSKLYEASLADLTYARAELKRIAARRQT